MHGLSFAHAGFVYLSFSNFNEVGNAYKQGQCTERSMINCLYKQIATN